MNFKKIFLLALFIGILFLYSSCSQVAKFLPQKGEESAAKSEKEINAEKNRQSEKDIKDLEDRIEKLKVENAKLKSDNPAGSILAKKEELEYYYRNIKKLPSLLKEYENINARIDTFKKRLGEAGIDYKKFVKTVEEAHQKEIKERYDNSRKEILNEELCLLEKQNEILKKPDNQLIAGIKVPDQKALLKKLDNKIEEIRPKIMKIKDLSYKINQLKSAIAVVEAEVNEKLK